MDGAEVEVEGRAAGEFWRKVQRGEFTALLEEPLQRVVAEAAEEQGLDLEIGGLRVLLVRRLAEDVAKQALGASRVVQALTQAVRARAAMQAMGPNPWDRSLQEVLAELAAGLLPMVGPGRDDEDEEPEGDWPTHEEVMATIAADGEAGYEAILGKRARERAKRRDGD